MPKLLLKDICIECNACITRHFLSIESKKPEYQLEATQLRVNMATVIPAKKYKSRHLLHEGYTFRENKYAKKTATSYYKCRHPNCGATGVKRGSDGIFQLTKDHTEHIAASLDEQVDLFVERMKDRAETETTPLKVIYTEESQRPE